MPNLREVRISGAKENNTITKVSLDGIEYLKGLKILRIAEDVEIDDFSPLYGLENLEILLIYNQRNLKEIDLTKFPNLKKISLNGCGVEKIVGMENIEPKEGQVFNFEACSHLKEVQGIEKFMTKMVENEKLVKPILLLDDIFYNRVMDKEVKGKKVNEELEQKFINEKQTKFGGCSLKICTEFCDDCFRSELNSRGTPMQMRTQRKYLDYILKNECGIKETDQDWVKAKKAYDWITENFHYAHGMKELEEQRKAFGGKGFDHYNIGSAYFSLMQRYDLKPADNELGFDYKKEIKGKFAVCEGIANVYIQMLQRMNIEAHFTAIKIDEIEENQNGTSMNGKVEMHGFVAAKIGDQYYYFDPTWDLGENYYHHFGLNLEEAKIRHEDDRHKVQFLNEEERFKGEKSNQQLFEQKNFLWRGENEIIIPRRRNKQPGLIEYFGAMKYAQKLLNTKIGQKTRENLQRLTSRFQENVVGKMFLSACDVVNYFAGIPVNVAKQVNDTTYAMAKNSVKSTQNIFKRLYDFSRETKQHLTNFVEKNFKHGEAIRRDEPKNENTDLSLKR